MIYIAHFSLVLALFCTLYAIIASVISLKKQAGWWLISAANALRAIAGLLTLAVFLLVYFLLKRDFQIEYVAHFTDLKLPTEYVLSALWAGQKGSLLLWGWLLSVCSALFISTYRNMPRRLHVRYTLKVRGTLALLYPELPYIYLVFALTLGFFLVLLLFATNPFQQLAFIPLDGNGLDPLLQNPYMVIHPPVLFIGYAGFIVPFALALAALCTGTIDQEWIVSVKRWTLFSWYFLGIGILLGAHWAYLELGWGGYWAWDPVENASLIPWLISTALIHTLILQRRRGFLQRWNISLSILIFLMCVFGTFITRSGILASVHAFTESTVGPYFLVFLTVTLLSAAVLIGYRWNAWRSHQELQALLSKENSLFITNQLLIGLAFAVFYGTVYPLFSELITGKKVVISTSFFNKVSIPIGLILLALIGICQRIPWNKVSLQPLRNRFLLPLSITLIGSALLVVFGIKRPLAILPCSLGIFIFTTTCGGIGKIVLAIGHSNTFEKKPLRRRGLAFLGSQKRFIASHIFHLGIALIYIGIAMSSTYRLEKEVALKPGESVTLGNIRFNYKQLNSYEDEQKGGIFAEIEVYENDQKIATVTPEKRFYGQSPKTQVTTEIGLYSSLQKDIYVILEGWHADQTATLTLIINPFIIWIWIGGFLVVTIGMLILLFPKRQTKI